jgi:DNA repair protein RadC
MAIGAESMSNAELLAIIIGQGAVGKSAVDLGRDILKECDENLLTLSKYSPTKLRQIKGIGDAKAVAIAAAFELGRRANWQIHSSSKVQIRSSIDAATIMSPLLSHLDHEECWVLFLNKSNNLITKERISIGGIDSTLIDIKIISKHCIEKLCSGIILVHNHPSGNRKASKSDIVQTESLKKALNVIDVSLLDHIIICGDKYYSFADEDMF